MDAFSRHIEGRRGKGRPCPCCVETPSKAQRSRLARARLSEETRRLADEAMTDHAVGGVRESRTGDCPGGGP